MTTSGSRFLLAARHCEIAELEELARTAELVGVIAEFIHALQRERGMSNIFLSSRGARFAGPRIQQALACDGAGREVRAQFERLDTGHRSLRNGSRLFSRIALVLHALDELPLLRQRIGAQTIGARDATAAFSRLVAGLLAVVFEAADNATDPEITRALVAMFNFMQGKEFAGQERAFGARVFTAGQIDAAGQQQWQHLVASQHGCFQVFHDFAAAEVLAADRASQDAVVLAQVERLRVLGATVRGGEFDADLSAVWYEQCTRRIDAMRSVEDALAAHLRVLCDRRIAQARGELRDQRTLLESLAAQADAEPRSGAAPYGRQVERSIVSLVQEQSRRLQAMGDELDAARASLNERKLVERAKGLLMAHRHMSEDEAYKALRQMAMNQKKRMADVAEAVLALAAVLPGGAR